MTNVVMTMTWCSMIETQTKKLRDGDGDNGCGGDIESV